LDARASQPGRHAGRHASEDRVRKMEALYSLQALQFSSQQRQKGKGASDDVEDYSCA
jgi:hypothetical protein